MANKPPGRNRPVNVAIPPVLQEFLRRLSRATQWAGDIERFIDPRTSAVTPGSHDMGWQACDPDLAGINYLFQNILSKYDDGKPSPEKEIATARRFKEAEELCSQTNVRLTDGRSGFGITTQAHVSLISAARAIISNVLGPLDLDEIAGWMTFTSGASTRLPRRKGDAAYKFSGKPESTPGNACLAEAAIRYSPLWFEGLLSEGDPSLLSIVEGNRIVTVPKNYKTDRTIAIEPCMNMYVQKGFGNVIRRRLRRVGVNLDSQELNRRFALIGSVGNGLATIDLSMASDTISYELVRQLLPSDWFEALEQCRSPIGVLASGVKVLYRKFSSMGNGYTFELESMIFWALAQAVAGAYRVDDRRIAVYGDDIIVPSSMARPLISLLEFCGFRTNEDKTFVDGPFRESCGKHYFRGYDVTPFFVKKEPRVLTDLFLLHNQLYRWCIRNQWNMRWDREQMRDLCSWLRAKAPSNWRRPRLPDGVGDGAFIGTFDDCRPTRASSRKRYMWWDGFIVEQIVQTVVLADLTELGFGIPGRVFRPTGTGPTWYGRLLRSLHPSLYSSEGEGGLPLSTRARVVMTHVQQFSTEDPFEDGF